MRATSTSQNSASSWALLIKVDFLLLNLSLLLLGGLTAMMRELFFEDYESEAHGTLNILSSHIKYRKICKRTLRITFPKYWKSSFGGQFRSWNGKCSPTRVCDLRIFEIAFEERKQEERIESNSTFQFPSEVSSSTGARLMQWQEMIGRRISEEAILVSRNSFLAGASTTNHVSKKIT